MITDPYVVATLKGIVEALTEFLPVSSTGHLMLMNAWMHFAGDGFTPSGDFMDLFDIFIQFGAILAVCVEYRKSLWQRLWQALKREPAVTVDSGGDAGPAAAPAAADGMPTPSQARRFWIALTLGTLPILAVGFALKKILDGIEASPYILPILAAAWIVGGAVMWLNEVKAPTEHTGTAWDIDWKSALWIGLFQCVALWPGISRSAATIIAGRRLGLSKQAAAEFSFFLAVPALTAASAYKLLKHHELLDRHNLGVLAVGTVVSFLGAWLIIRAFLAFLRRFSFTPFAIYRILLGLLVLGAYCGGWRMGDSEDLAGQTPLIPTAVPAPAEPAVGPNPAP